MEDLEGDITFYYHQNSYDHIGIYAKVDDIDSVNILELSSDSDHIILNSMINRIWLIKNIGKDSPIFRHNRQIISNYTS